MIKMFVYKTYHNIATLWFSDNVIFSCLLATTIFCFSKHFFLSRNLHFYNTLLTILPLVVFQSHVPKNPETKISINEQAEISLYKLITYSNSTKKALGNCFLNFLKMKLLWIVGNSHEFSQKKKSRRTFCLSLLAEFIYWGNEAKNWEKKGVKKSRVVIM